MITVVKQILNAIYMYVYLVYYSIRLEVDPAFFKLEQVRRNRALVLAKRERYTREYQWKS